MKLYSVSFYKTLIAIPPKHDGKILLFQNFIGSCLESVIEFQFLKAYLESLVGQYLLEQKLTESAILMLISRQLREVPVILSKTTAQVQRMSECEQKKNGFEEQLKKFQIQ